MKTAQEMIDELRKASKRRQVAAKAIGISKSEADRIEYVLSCDNWNDLLHRYIHTPAPEQAKEVRK